MASFCRCLFSSIAFSGSNLKLSFLFSLKFLLLGSESQLSHQVIFQLFCTSLLLQQLGLLFLESFLVLKVDSLQHRHVITTLLLFLLRFAFTHKLCSFILLCFHTKCSLCPGSILAGLFLLEASQPLFLLTNELHLGSLLFFAATLMLQNLLIQKFLVFFLLFVDFLSCHGSDSPALA